MDKLIKSVEDCKKLGFYNLSNTTYGWFIEAAERYQKYQQGECTLDKVSIALSNFTELYTNETGIKCDSVIRLGKLIFNGSDAYYKGTLWTIRRLLEGASNVSVN